MYLIGIILLVLGLAKHGKGRRRGSPLLVLPIDDTTALLTTGPDAVVKGDFTGTVDSDTWLLSADFLPAIRNHTAGEGPLVVGVAHSDYTAAEIEEALEATTSWNQKNKIEQERRRRKVRRIGQFAGDSTEEVLNDGKPIRVKLGFKIEEGETLSQWIWNRSGGSLTTGSVLIMSGNLFARRM